MHHNSTVVFPFWGYSSFTIETSFVGAIIFPYFLTFGKSSPMKRPFLVFSMHSPEGYPFSNTPVKSPVLVFMNP